MIENRLVVLLLLQTAEVLTSTIAVVPHGVSFPFLVSRMRQGLLDGCSKDQFHWQVEEISSSYQVEWKPLLCDIVGVSLDCRSNPCSVGRVTDMMGCFPSHM